jgi:hypothetical protein
MATERHESHRMNGGTHGASGGTDPGAVARDVAGRTADAASDVASRIPSTTRDALSTAQMRMESSSDEVLMNGSMLSLGVALGLLLGGSNRLLVAMALIPAAAMGATLLDRRNRAG